MQYGITLTNIGQELIAKPFSVTRPAISTISTVAGIVRTGLQISLNTSRRGSGTFVEPKLGSMVQKGKLALCALPELMQLNKVDLPTLGSPTIPHFNDISIF